MDAREKMIVCLKDAGYSVYDPGVHVGECKTPYIVVRQMGTYASIQSNRTGYALVTVICYVPLRSHAALQPMVDAVKEALESLKGQSRRTGHETPDMIEETYKAHSRAVEYQVLKRLE